jgi:hypothetical protein
MTVTVYTTVAQLDSAENTFQAYKVYDENFALELCKNDIPVLMIVKCDIDHLVYKEGNKYALIEKKYIISCEPCYLFNEAFRSFSEEAQLILIEHMPYLIRGSSKDVIKKSIKINRGCAVFLNTQAYLTDEDLVDGYGPFSLAYIQDKTPAITDAAIASNPSNAQFAKTDEQIIKLLDIKPESAMTLTNPSYKVLFKILSMGNFAALNKFRDLITVDIWYYMITYYYSNHHDLQKPDYIQAYLDKIDLAKNCKPSTSNSALNLIRENAFNVLWYHDNNIIREAIAINPFVIVCIADTLKRLDQAIHVDPRVIFLSSRPTPEHLYIAWCRLANRKDMDYKAILLNVMKRCDPTILSHVPVDKKCIEFKSGDELIEYVLAQDGKYLEFLPVEMQTERNCMIAVKQNGLAREYVKSKTTEIMLAAVIQTYEAKEFCK